MSDSLVAQIKAAQGRQTAIGFGQFIQASAVAKGDMALAAEFARATWPHSLLVRELDAMVMKAAIAPGSTADSTWAGPLAQATPLASEFAELVRGLSVLGRLNARSVPFNTKFGRTTAGSSASWVGQGQPAPVSKMDFEGLTLPFAKIVSIAVITQELAKSPTAAAATTISADLAAVVATFMDAALLDPDLAAVADTSPASLTYGAVQLQSSGNSAANVVADLRAMMMALIAGGVRLRDAVWIMSERVAAAWCTLYNTNSDLMFEDLTPAGGFLFGLPVLTTGTLHSTGSPSEEVVTLVDPQSIAVADDGNTAVDVARNPTLQMVTNPATGAQQGVSLWQANLIGLKLTRFVNWVRRRDGAVVCLRSINL